MLEERPADIVRMLRADAARLRALAAKQAGAAALQLNMARQLEKDADYIERRMHAPLRYGGV